MEKIITIDLGKLEGFKMTPKEIIDAVLLAANYDCRLAVFPKMYCEQDLERYFNAGRAIVWGRSEISASDVDTQPTYRTFDEFHNNH